MREFWIKVLRRAVPVAIVLGIMGYVLAEVFLMLHKMNGGVPDPANEAVRWRTPLMMAGAGLAILVGLEFLMYLIRRNNVPATSCTDTELQKPSASP